MVTMTCESCNANCKRFGKHRNGLRRFRCTKCGKTYTEPHERRHQDLEGSDLPLSKIVQILQLLVEGCSVRTVERITGTHRDTILRVLNLAGEKCAELMDRMIVNVPCRDVECDEIWGYVFKKEGHKRPAEANNDSIGDAYCWVAIERHTKLVLAFTVGRRTLDNAFDLMRKVREATSPDYRFQLTTDGLSSYIPAVDEILSDRCDYAQLIKVYAAEQIPERRYSPPDVINAVPMPISGDPDKARICTSHVERQNLTIRMQMRRINRLTNAFSKKVENLWSAYALHFAYQNFCRIHRSLRVTPAMEAGIADHVWSIGDLLSA